MRRTLKHLLLAAGLLLPASHALASDWSSWESSDALHWGRGGQSLDLTTDKAGGVRVVQEMPVNLWGLAEGDLILQADGKPVAAVADFLVTLRDHGISPMPLKVRRRGTEQAVLLAPQACAELLEPLPPPIRSD
ncbi:hypothetical protein [Dyella japonica]|uniref:PDZ domain-containing protein n=1 Tax=Dyella japonica A8 TaxID=1217721 RepID=A0A075K512_9GAMM|nr:hypothetical protein [Dyella japonica]AIF49249.1 hypothetical protein HY57_19335 [Dyella japonica A8]